MLKKLNTKIRSPQGRRDLKYTISRKILNPILKGLGYTVIADHFYQPIPNSDEVMTYEKKERDLSSIKWNLQEQLEFTSNLLDKYGSEFNDKNIISFYGYSETSSGLCSGDSEFLYSIIREKKPKKIIEVGSGGSTLIIAAALRMNFLESQEKSQLISIEPYPQEFLKRLSQTSSDYYSYTLLEQKIQETDLSIFKSLSENDILFIDSSHVFKQGSDVEFEFLQVYPSLEPGVIVHIHDIFFPFDYPVDWNLVYHRYWNEQYFLEVFLQFNERFQVLTSLSMINWKNQSIFLKNIKAFHEERVPGSFWMIVCASRG
jgi:hypothetical protein